MKIELIFVYLHGGMHKMVYMLQTTCANAYSWKTILCVFFIKIELIFVSNSPIDIKSELFQTMAWCQPGNKPLPEP